jgi:hypothetical protein
MSDMNFLKNELAVGMPVFVYGNTKTREEVVPSVKIDLTLTGAVEIPASSS